jgi:hypothetical protein
MDVFDSKEVEWSDLSLYLNGTKVGKFTGNKYKKDRETEFLYASGDEPASIQRGNKSYTGTFSCLKSLQDAMNKAAQALGGEDLYDVDWTIVNVYRAKGTRLIQTDTQIGVVFESFERGMVQNDKKPEIALPYKYLRLNPQNAIASSSLNT